MGFRLFRRIRIAPGLSLNLSKGGLSLSAGVRGARVTVGRRGVRGTVGAPGTGISYSETIGGGSGGSGDERSRGGVGCGTILLALLLFGWIANQCSPSGGGSSWSDSTPEPSQSASVEPSGPPSPDLTAPIALSVAALPATKRGAAVDLEVSAAYGALCEVGVPSAARTGDGPLPVQIPEGGTATISWTAGAKAASSVITVVCTLGDQREALELTLVVK